MRLLKLLSYCSLVTVAGIQVASADNLDWAKTALKYQEQLDVNKPLAEAFFPGAHNAYATYQWDDSYVVDPNQYYTPYRLLTFGIREMSFDVYPALQGFDYVPYLCHNSLGEDAYCTTENKKFSEGLSVIKDFINENPDSVIILKIEAFKNTLNSTNLKDIGKKIDSKIGDIVYKPADYATADCGSLPVGTLSKADVLAEGKNVIVVTTSNSASCSYYNNSKFRDFVWIGVDDNSGSTTNSNQKFEGISDVDDCQSLSAAQRQGMMLRAVDDNTYRNQAGASIKTSTLPELMACGLNVAEAALVEYINGVAKVYMEDYVWSWNTDQPNDLNSNEDCAVHIPDGRFNDTVCSYDNKFACSDDNGNWKITATTGEWSMGNQQCASEFGSQGYSFGVPKNAWENAQLIAAKADAGVIRTWLDYSDLDCEGTWIVDASDVTYDISEQGQYTDIVTAVGGNINMGMSSKCGMTTQTWTATDAWGSNDYTWTGDFNGDGKSDLASASGGNVYMKLSTGSGFTSTTWTVPNAWGGSGYTWVADFNGDGKSDIASASGSSIYMHLSTGSGFNNQTWSVPNSWGSTSFTWTGDFNGDGKADIASASGNNVYMHLSTGSGFSNSTWTVANDWSSSGYTWVGDFNGDGRSDLATAIGGNIYMHLSNGSSFSTQTWTVPSNWGGSSYSWVGDFNNDGKSDIASASGSDVYMHLSNGNGFSSSTWPVKSVWGDESETFVADFNHDGRSDIASIYDGNIRARLSTGSGFTEEFWTGPSSWSSTGYIFVGDFDDNDE